MDRTNQAHLSVYFNFFASLGMKSLGQQTRQARAITPRPSVKDVTIVSTVEYKARMLMNRAIKSEREILGVTLFEETKHKIDTISSKELED
mmetsp:Transcript_20504/g.30444  ORF Transcript_20504/g.30444 Transcript_20504/m.30444 type:complete len:91 (-) Transcript_20504:471-743(-)